MFPGLIAKKLDEALERPGFDIVDSEDANLLKHVARPGPDAPKRADRKPPQKIVDTVGRNNNQSIRFFTVGGQLGKKLVGSNPDRGGQLRCLADACLDALP